MGHFSRTFVKARATMGFKTAYAFYHSNGGRRVFPFTYAYYLNVERGASLPSPPWLAVLLETLRATGSAQRSHLVNDYLRDLSGDAAVYDGLFAPLVHVPAEPEAERVMRNLRGHITHNVTPAQYRCLASSPEKSACLSVLANTRGALSAGRVAELLGSGEKTCAEALKELRRMGLVRALPGGRYSCRHLYHSMPTDSDSLRVCSKVRDNLDVFARRQGQPFADSWATMRLDRSAVDAVVKDLNEAVLAAASRGVVREDESGSSVCFVECRLRRIGGAAPDRAVAVPGRTERPAGHRRASAGSSTSGVLTGVD